MSYEAGGKTKNLLLGSCMPENDNNNDDNNTSGFLDLGKIKSIEKSYYKK